MRAALSSNALRSAKFRAACLSAALLASAAGAQAETIDSVYTDLKLEQCRTIEPSSEPEDGGRLECEGLPRLPVQVAEGDLRFFVGFGGHPDKQCAFHQTFPSFNSLGAKVEWRRADGKPFAAILRWYVQMGETGERKSWLVVTRLGRPEETCHTAYVEGASPDANALARRYADEFARSFDCSRDKPDVSVKSPDAQGQVPARACE